MRSCRMSNVLAVFAAWFVLFGLARAAPPAPRKGNGNGRKPDAKLEALRVWKLTQELNLDEEQSAPFFANLTRSRKVRETYRASRRSMLDNLGIALKKKTLDIEELQAGVDSLETLEDSRRAEERSLRQELRSILSVEQLARFFVLQADFDRQARRVIGDIRRGQEHPGK